MDKSTPEGWAAWEASRRESHGKPPTIAVRTRTDWGADLVRITHPEGVECDFTIDGQCSCGRLQIGIVRPVYAETHCDDGDHATTGGACDTCGWVSGAELDRLVRWKAEALVVLDEWEKVWEAAGRPGPLGESKARAVLRLLEER